MQPHEENRAPGGFFVIDGEFLFQYEKKLPFIGCGYRLSPLVSQVKLRTIAPPPNLVLQIRIAVPIDLHGVIVGQYQLSHQAIPAIDRHLAAYHLENQFLALFRGHQESRRGREELAAAHPPSAHAISRGFQGPP